VGRFRIEEFPALGGVHADISSLGVRIAKLVLSSREAEARIFDSNATPGAYAIVLEGKLETGFRERAVVADRYRPIPATKTTENWAATRPRRRGVGGSRLGVPFPGTE